MNIIQEFADITVVSLAAILGLGILAANKKSIQNLSYFAVAVSILFWILFGHLLYYPFFKDFIVLFGRLNFFAFSIWCVVLYIFILNFPKTQEKWKFRDIVFIGIGCLFALLSMSTSLIVIDIRTENFNVVWDMGALATPLYGYATLTALIIMIRLVFKYRKASCEDRARIRLFSYGILLVLLFNIVFNVFYPIYYSRDDLYWLGDESLIFLLGFTAYAIIKHHLFNIKVIATETAVILLSIGLLAEVFVSDSATEGILKGIVWVLATYGGYVLIKSVKKEIQQKEQLQVLAKKLDKANQDLEELDEAKDNFLSMAAHELNTPIAAIEGYLSMIIDEKMAGKLPAKAEEYLNYVYSSSKRLAALVKDLLNVSRIESGRIHLIFEEAQVEDVIDQAIKEVKIKADEVGHALTFEKTGKLPKTWFDVARVTEVVINMLGNAIKYTDAPGKISVLTHSDGDKIVVAIQDNGRGIPKDKSDHIFEKFAQVDVLKDQVKGTGLGMFITKNLIELHKGKVWFKSSTDEKDHGTTFFFSLPILKQKPFDPHEGEGALFQSKPAAGTSASNTETKKVDAPATTDAETDKKAEPISPAAPVKESLEKAEKIAENRPATAEKPAADSPETKQDSSEAKPKQAATKTK